MPTRGANTEWLILKQPPQVSHKPCALTEHTGHRCEGSMSSLGPELVQASSGLSLLGHGQPACGSASCVPEIMEDPLGLLRTPFAFGAAWISSARLTGHHLHCAPFTFQGLKNQPRVKLNIVRCPPVTTVLIRRPDLRYQLGFSVQNGIVSRAPHFLPKI